MSCGAIPTAAPLAQCVSHTHLGVQHIRLELHERIVGCHASIYLQLCRGHAVSSHGIQHLYSLEGGAL